MTNTNYLKTDVEEYVRKKLEEEYGISFSRSHLSLTTGGTHEFNAVSRGGEIVATIRSSGGITSGGNSPSGKIKGAIADLYFLSLVNARERLLVLTSTEFYQLLSDKLAGKVAPGIVLKPVPLPDVMASKVEHVQKVASKEVDGRW